MVQDISVNPGVCPLSENTPLEIWASSRVESSRASDWALQYWGAALDIRVRELDREIPAEGYQLEVERCRIAIYCSDTAGLYNAFKTLRMASESERGVMTSSKWQLPCMII